MRTTPMIPAQAPATYAAIVQQTNPEHAEIAMRTETADKQILIQKDKNTADNMLTSLSELDLVTKMNTALDLMGWEGSDKPRNMTFIASKKLQSGSVLYHMNLAETAAWMSNGDVQKAFMNYYNRTSTIRNKLHHVIAEFVLITFDAGSSYAHTKLEDNNLISERALTFLKYIKLLHL